MLEIDKSEVFRSGIVLHLNNGVVVNLSVNPDYLHLSLSHIKIDEDYHGLTIKPAYQEPGNKTVAKSSNYVEILYKPK